LEVIDMLNNLLGKNIEPTHIPKKLGDVMKTMSDPSLAKKELNFACNYSFEEGLKETVDFFTKK